MKKVITYGTFDLLHFGHINLLKNARALGDYLIVGITSDDYDKSRGKINVQQPLIERIENVRATGLADEIIVEEFDGQKIDDIKRYDVDIFTVGSDWKGKFDYLSEYCEVVYLNRTQGISSSQIRAETGDIKFGIVGNVRHLEKLKKECGYINGINMHAICTENPELKRSFADCELITESFELLIKNSDAVYICSHPDEHYRQIKYALENGKHVLCESPVAVSESECRELFELAKKNGCVLMDSIKTAYSTAYYRLLLLLKSGQIGDVVSVDSTVTSLRSGSGSGKAGEWNSMYSWGPTALLPVFQILGENCKEKKIVSRLSKSNPSFDLFTKIDFVYDNAVASIKIGKGVKSEGELVISGTKGYVIVPAPWWKTDYFEIRYEDTTLNKRYFYPLEGEGFRYELLNFLKNINTGRNMSYIPEEISAAICRVVSDFNSGVNLVKI